ncbi:MAG: phosphatase PAP2 family protein [Bacteroidota bacterium]
MTASVLLLSFFHKLWIIIDQWDTQLFLKINTQWNSAFLDSVFPWWREANAWVPLYLFFVIFALQNFKQKAIPWILFVVLTLVITDQLSSTLIKNWVARPRPCRDEFLESQVRLILNNCSGGYSFPSSHATNHFGFAVFICITLKPILKKWRYLFLLWAATICYGQVYVGVHYPVDVLCGALLGSLIGYGTAVFYNKKIGLVM